MEFTDLQAVFGKRLGQGIYAQFQMKRGLCDTQNVQTVFRIACEVFSFFFQMTGFDVFFAKVADLSESFFIDPVPSCL